MIACAVICSLGGVPVVFDTVSSAQGMKLFTCVREGFATATAFNIVYDNSGWGSLISTLTRSIEGWTSRKCSLLETLGQHLGVAINSA